MNNRFSEFECAGLSLKLGSKTLFHDFHFKFNGPGIVFIEGENGAGKSSLLKVFAGLMEPISGKITYSGYSSKMIGRSEYSYFTTSSLGLLNNMTGREHIEIVARSLMLDPSKVSLWIQKYSQMEIFNEILDKNVEDLSQGMKQFLRLFLHLFFEPEVIYLDEPLLYLSPKIKSFFQCQIEAMCSRSIFFITDQQISWTPKVKTEKIMLNE